MKKYSCCFAIALLLFLLLNSCKEDEPATIPTVTTSGITDITKTTAVASGVISSDGRSPILSNGFVWDTSPVAEIFLSTKTNSTGSGTGPFSGNLNGLNAGTTYYVRAYATNAVGLAYGNEVSFETAPSIPPTVVTLAATSISYTTATIGGNITDAGTDPVTEKGIVYGKTENPTTTDSKMIHGEGADQFTVSLTNLELNVTYHARAYAISDAGTSYGNPVSFTMKAYVAPTITTFEATQLTETDARVGGNVVAVGTLAVTEKGIVYSLAANPTVEDIKIALGSGKGTFYKTVDGLTKKTKYYMRAYAITSVGTHYGSEINFVTPVAVNLPSSVLGRWFKLSTGELKYTFTNNEEIIIGDYEDVYMYSSYDVTFTDNYYDITAHRMGWSEPKYIRINMTPDTNRVFIQSLSYFTGTLYQVSGRSLTSVTWGTGRGGFINLWTGTWIGTDDEGNSSTWSYTQTGVDDWSVYLTRNDGARFQIDLTKKIILYSPTQTGAMTELYKLTHWYSD